VPCWTLLVKFKWYTLLLSIEFRIKKRETPTYGRQLLQPTMLVSIDAGLWRNQTVNVGKSFNLVNVCSYNSWILRIFPANSIWWPFSAVHCDTARLKNNQFDFFVITMANIDLFPNFFLSFSYPALSCSVLSAPRSASVLGRWHNNNNSRDRTYTIHRSSYARDGQTYNHAVADRASLLTFLLRSEMYVNMSL